MFEKLKNIFKPKAAKPTPPPTPKKPRKPRQRKAEPQLSAKEAATLRGEPWVEIQKFEIDAADIHTGNFVIDYNEAFVLNLVRAGYKQKDSDTDYEIVDRWFTQVCRSVVLEYHEQLMADPGIRGDMRIIRTRDIGGGRSEVS